MAASDIPRSAGGFDLRWHNLVDSGALILAAHYQVLDASGRVAVTTQTVSGTNVQSAQNLEAVGQAGSYSLRLWLEDSEGNVGAPVPALLTYDCAHSPVAGGVWLAAHQPAQTVQ